MTKNYKQPTTPYGRVNWKLMCPIESYMISRSISAEKPDVLNRHDSLLIDARVRFPKELYAHSIQIDFWKTNKPHISSDNRPHIAIGAFSFIEKSEYIDEDCYYIDQPAQPDFFEDIVRSLLDTDLDDGIFREIHIEVIGLLNEWDRSGSLDVKKIELQLCSSKSQWRGSTPKRSET